MLMMCRRKSGKDRREVVSPADLTPVLRASSMITGTPRRATHTSMPLSSQSA
jgi:hypothetical protein